MVVTHTELDTNLILVVPVDTWNTIDLTSYGVPNNAVVEVFCSNYQTSAEYIIGVREVGSSLNRYLNIAEMEGGGHRGYTTYVQTDSTASIEYYWDVAGLTIKLLGYFEGCTFTELAQGHNAAYSWEDLTLTAGANVCHTMTYCNGHGTAALAGGARANGSSLERTCNLNEAEDGGYTACTWLVQSDESMVIEAQDNGGGAMYDMGYFDFTWIELHQDISPASGSWEDVDLSSYISKDGDIVYINGSHNNRATYISIGAQENGSSLARAQTLGEAETNGRLAIGMAVTTDANGIIECLYGANVEYILTGYIESGWGHSFNSVSSPAEVNSVESVSIGKINSVQA